MKYELTENLTAEMFNDHKERINMTFLTKIDQIFRELKELGIEFPKVIFNKEKPMTAEFHFPNSEQLYYFFKFATMYAIPYIRVVGFFAPDLVIELSIDPKLYNGVSKFLIR